MVKARFGPRAARTNIAVATLRGIAMVEIENDAMETRTLRLANRRRIAVRAGQE